MSIKQIYTVHIHLYSTHVHWNCDNRNIHVHVHVIVNSHAAVYIEIFASVEMMGTVGLLFSPHSHYTVHCIIQKKL